MPAPSDANEFVIPAGLVPAGQDAGRVDTHYPRGNPETPVSTETLEAKFVELVAPRLGDAFAQCALMTVRSLHDSADVRALFSELFPPPAA